LQVTATHQENSVTYYGIVLGCVVAPNSAGGGSDENYTGSDAPSIGEIIIPTGRRRVAQDNTGGFLGTSLTAGEFFSSAWSGALGGAAGFQNVLTFGWSSTAGFDQASVQTGRGVGKATMVTAGAVGTAGAFSLASGTPYFFSGAGASAQAAASGYIVTDTAGGMVANGAQQALNTVFGARIGGTIGYYGIWYPTSAVYATTSGLLNGVVGYTGNGTGQIWTQVEQPILQFLGTTVKTGP
jgi:hypothetical protein